MSQPYKRKEIIGDCTLYLGDCMEVMADFEENSLDMIWTDPPYGHNNNEGDLAEKLSTGAIDGRAYKKPVPIANDSMDDMRRVVDGMLEQAARVLKKDSCCCCCCGGGPRPTFAWLAERMDKKGLSFFHSVIWDKINCGLGWRYRRQHEMVMVAHRKGGNLAWAEHAIATPNIIKISAPSGAIRVHPNEKPLILVQGFIERHTMIGDTVLDPFMGSGTTLVACAKMGRKGIGIELDEGYFDIACKRVEDAYKQSDLFIAAPDSDPYPEYEQGGLFPPKLAEGAL